jgi:hypothetical protein
VREEDERVATRLHIELETVGVVGDESSVEDDAEAGRQPLEVLIEGDGESEFTVRVGVGEGLMRRDSDEGETV